MIQLYKGIPFSPQAELTADIGAEDTVIKVSDVSVFPDAPNYATIGTDEGGETVLYTAKSEEALSGCQRGVEGEAKAWKSGEIIARNFTAKDHNDLIEQVGASDTALQSKADLGEDGKLNPDQLPENIDAATLGEHDADYFANDALTEAEIDEVWNEVFTEVAV